MSFIRSDTCTLTNLSGSGSTGYQELFSFKRPLQKVGTCYIFSTGNVNNSDVLLDGKFYLPVYWNMGSAPVFRGDIEGEFFGVNFYGVLGLTCIHVPLKLTLISQTTSFQIGITLPDWWGPGADSDYAWLEVFE